MADFRELLNTVLWYFVLAYLRVYKFIHLAFIKYHSEDVKKLVIDRFKESGITVNGKDPWDIQVLDERFYVRVAHARSLGLGESYMDGWWKVGDLTEFCRRTFDADESTWTQNPLERFADYLEMDLFNHQTTGKAFEVAEAHYNLGNEFFESFLDPTMNYTCAYWKRATTLEQAQKDKMELIAQKLKLEPGMKVLDIGCGWGGLAYYLASKHGVSVVGCTVSVEGAKFGNERCKAAGLSVELRVADYREMNQLFDRVVSIGMFEHAGNHNYEEYFKVAHRCLKPRGIFLLHTIGTCSDSYARVDPWFNKYVFPNVRLPYPMDLTNFANKKLILEDWHNFGPDYTKTLLEWDKNFMANWAKVKDQFQDPERFYRMWRLYLHSTAGGFSARKLQLWQVVYSKGGVIGGYEAVR